ncbi:hypothetical protein GCM10027294_52970 [Marinactinospora endophytica]
MSRQPVNMDELVEHWTVLDDEQDLVTGKRGTTKLGFALLMKYYTRHGRFPRGRADFPDEVVGFVARQVKVPATDFGFYEWSGRTIEYHRKQTEGGGLAVLGGRGVIHGHRSTGPVPRLSGNLLASPDRFSSAR